LILIMRRLRQFTIMSDITTHPRLYFLNLTQV